MQGWLSKYFTLAAIVFFLCCMSFFFWAKSHRDLRIYEKEVATYFKEFKRLDFPVSVRDILVLNPQGHEQNLATFQGNYLIINVWATWCTPCLTELPSLRKLKQRLEATNSRWKVIAVSVDTKANMGRVADMAQKLDVAEFASYFDHKNMMQDGFGIKKLPVTFIVSGSGKILYIIEGDAFWHDQAIIEFLQKIQLVY